MQLPKLNEKEKLQLRLQIQAEIYRRSFYDFFVDATKVLYPQVQWDYNWHFKYICDLLQAEVERIIRKEEKQHDLIINLCRRSGKSILVSQLFPIYCWIKDDSMGIMQVSHNQIGAIKNSFYSKILLESAWFKALFPEITLRIDTHAKQNYMTKNNGKRQSFGITSASILGEGCMVQICDDISSPFDSADVTQGINDIYNDVLYGTLNDNRIGLRIICQQRVADYDICGYLLKKNPLKFLNICIPARLSQDLSPAELVEFYNDKLFWQTRFSEAMLQDVQSQISSRAFAGQYQQRPQLEEGGIIKRSYIKSITKAEWLKITSNEKDITWNLYVDTAYTTKQKNDATAITCACKFNNSVYIKGAWNVREEFPELVKTLKKIKLSTGARLIYVETKASGLSVIQQLRRDGFDVGELNPKDRDKLSRLNAVSSTIEGGRLCVIKDENDFAWIEMLISELANVPFGAWDLCDTVVYSIENLLNNSGLNYSFL